MARNHYGFTEGTDHRIIGLFSLSHEQNKARFNYAVARKQRRSQFKRNLYGIFLVA